MKEGISADFIRGHEGYYSELPLIYTYETKLIHILELSTDK